jgi:hypothetical protein
MEEIRTVTQLSEVEKSILILLYKNPSGLTLQQLQQELGCTREDLYSLGNDTFHLETRGVDQYIKLIYLFEDTSQRQENRWKYRLTDPGIKFMKSVRAFASGPSRLPLKKQKL